MVLQLDETYIEIFVEITSRRDSATLDDIVTRHDLPGTIIHTDSWRGYGNLNNLGYIHRTVNHNQNFVDPNTGVHTQAIESAWSHIKRAIKKEERIQGSFVGRPLPGGRMEMEE
ncbi:unnamed protein product [Heligmosomoides polygyrus]|uniref:DDE_Tnp_IS1595 domain-containing protein n=1 Tax=Heligmosomoides polygyrus TaxID=6339 RepID=A0A183F8C1_HELPZ|nr:unnamed protein product [Heligmosomoides polygyrus]